RQRRGALHPPGCSGCGFPPHSCPRPSTLTGGLPASSQAGSSRGNQAMSTSRIALVAEDQRLVGAVQTHLKKAVGQPAFTCKFDPTRAPPGWDPNGTLILTAATPSDCEQVCRLVQEICLQKLPPDVVLLVGDGAEGDPALDLSR